MSWLDKLFKMFQDKEEQEINVQIEQNTHYEHKGKDLEAKVKYQYPKGFDISQIEIPSPKARKSRRRTEQIDNSSKLEPENQFEHVKRSERPSRRKNSKNEEVTILPDNTLKTMKVQQVTKEKSVEPQSKQVTKKSSRPFRATEIPSPVYGFNSRPSKIEVVEYELSSEVHNDPNLQNESIIESENELLFVIQSEEELGQFAENQSEELEIYHDQDELVNEEDHEQILAEAVVEVIQELELYNNNQEVGVEPEPFEDNDSLEYPITEECEEQCEQAELIQSEQPVEIVRSSRAHIPFNVLMLKQDKLSWEQKKQSENQPPQQLSISEESLNRTEPAVVQPEGLISTPRETEIKQPEKIHSNLYQFPTVDLLNPPLLRFAQENLEWTQHQEELLNEALKNFGVRAKVVNITQGPSVTRFEVQPEPGVKVNKITNLTDDIKLSLAAKDIRIEAPIPGKHTIGIEVPNKKSRPVLISEIIKSDAFQNSASPLTAVLGLDISGAPVVTDLKKMPHGLIAGATGSGKSVCINSILVSLLYKASPEELKLLLIDPKMVELAPYNHIPHLVSPVITDVKAATAALKWAVDEMERRYELFAHTGVRDINRFNEIAENHKRYSDKLPFIVIIIDELADLMMMSPADVEESICRIAQKARACGIHLIIATQRPSVDVITGLIKANVPTRTAFSVSSQIDSRTIIDISGAEKLLGRGDMLFLENGSSKPVRLQGTFVSDAEIDLVVEHVRSQQEPNYLFQQEELLKRAQVIEEEDELFYEACEYVIDQGGASTSSIQRRFKIGYNRAARLIDMMERQGFISEPKGSKPRDVLITLEELTEIQENSTGAFL